MSDPNDTLPPNTPRTWLLRAKAWCAAHPDWLLAFVFGFIAAGVIFG